MTLPLFPPSQDPGPSFAALISAQASAAGQALRFAGSGGGAPSPGSQLFPDIRHATTVVALKYSAGVVMAADRRATQGNVIAHRRMEKLFPADGHSAVAMAGAAGQAMELVRLFQTQLEHYEKVEEVQLSLEGKANQLGQLVRANLPAAMQGLVVVPLFAGFDLRRGVGRIFSYDATGGRYEELDFATTGSGGGDARTTIKLGWREGLDHGAAVELAVGALYEAADEDSATGGPDVVRGIYPTVAAITVGGFAREEQESVAERFAAVIRRKTGEGQSL
ncbi:MAG: proteasome subunit beta [Acidimicrobiales bacterium]